MQGIRKLQHPYLQIAGLVAFLVLVIVMVVSTGKNDAMQNATYTSLNVYKAANAATAKLTPPNTVQPFAMYHNQVVDDPASATVAAWASYGLVHLSTQNTAAVVKQLKALNPNAWILNYRQSNGVAAQTGAGGTTQPWGEKLRPDSLPEWVAANQHEDLFLHSADPANLLVNKAQSNNEQRRVTLTWAVDKRSMVGLIDIKGYNVYAGDAEKQTKKLAFVAVDQTRSFTYTALPDETHYRVTTVANTAPNSAATELAYSLAQAVDPKEKYIASVDFTTACVQPKPWPNYDCFHPYPGIDLRYTFTVTLAEHSDFQPQTVAIYYSKPKNSAFYYNPTPNNGTALPLTRVAQNIYTGSIVMASDRNISGSLAYFVYLRGTLNNGVPYARQYPTNNYALSTSINNRVRYLQHGTYVANILNPFWTTFSVEQITQLKERLGHNGIYVDLSWRSVTDGHGVYDVRGNGVPPRNDRGAIAAYQEAEYEVKLRYYTALKNADNYLILNHPDKQIGTAQDGMALIDTADGGKIESFVLSMNRGPKIYRDWVRDMEVYLQWQDKNKLAEIQPKFPLHAYQRPPYPTTSENDRWYAFTSYLLGRKSADSRAYYNLFPFGLSRPIPEYTIDLGAPAPDDYQALKDAITRGDRWFLRQYDKGIVIVNPSNRAIELDQITEVPRGSKVLRLDPTGEDGTIRAEDAVPTTVIPARSGRIIVTDNAVNPQSR